MPVIIDPPVLTVPAPDPGPLPSSGDRLYARLEPIAYADPDNGYPLKNLTGALMAPREILDSVTMDHGDTIGWGVAVDPDTAPDDLLDWLAQLVGVVFPASALTAAEKRSRIQQAAGFYRGTPRAIREEVQRVLTGTKYVGVFERPGGAAYQLTVVTRTSETPDAAAAERAARAQKPAGMVMTFSTTSTPIIDEGGAARTIDAIGSAGTTIDGVTVADWT